ncbi:MAG: polysaccharide deacetylase family protein [Gammaproteobacteria bacterium]|nr:polysaccharide deacetylase family protein [Gammaproteobacteria bacterium]MDD9960236.1 polysaccharide deacetylase family protein [Gammaproteobacteria bacterium]
MRYFLLLLLFISQLGLAASEESHGVILLYHHVATDTPPSTSISPEDFRAHLDYLRDNEFNVMALDAMIEGLKSGVTLPDKAVAISFDDGYISIYDTAFPLLQEYGFPFTLFLSTGPIDRAQSNYMTWAQVREMSDAGVIIANHMVEHPYMLERLDGEDDTSWLTRQESELLEAEQRILDETGQSHRYLAYPYGEFDPAIKRLLAKHEFVGLAQNSGAIGVNSDFLALPRFPLAAIYANLDTARTKLDTKAFNVELVEPASPVTAVRNPGVTLKFNPGNYNLSQIGCFANSQALPMEWTDRDRGIVEINPTEEYQGRRWRYICTAPVPNERRYYWYSVQWIKLD